MVAGAAELKVFSNGVCSFCGKHRRELRTLIGTPDLRIGFLGMDACVCDACLGFCCGLLAEAVGDKIDETLASEISADRLSGIVSRVVSKAAAGELRPPKKRATWAPDGYRCSFCGSPENEVARMLVGPHVCICETCVANAVAFVKQELASD